MQDLKILDIKRDKFISEPIKTGNIIVFWELAKQKFLSPNYTQFLSYHLPARIWYASLTPRKSVAGFFCSGNIISFIHGVA